MAPSGLAATSSHLVLSDHADRLTDVRVWAAYALHGVRLPGMVMHHRGDGRCSVLVLSPCWLKVNGCDPTPAGCDSLLNDPENPSIHTVAVLNSQNFSEYTPRASAWGPMT